eukprot:TRINITY_DN11561_c0_g1_i3.p2 TRINITY_DN11561_c0_g1~~TRINITY_DN11561_c0_g1_i3.p2  ORF type:complete len:122 (+),score=28.23 TRINITY_DN11561_c0_g1_i3:76-441(+)
MKKGGTPVGKEKTAGALMKLSVDDDNEIAIVQMPEALEALVELSKGGTPVGKGQGGSSWSSDEHLSTTISKSQSHGCLRLWRYWWSWQKEEPQWARGKEEAAGALMNICQRQYRNRNRTVA